MTDERKKLVEARDDARKKLDTAYKARVAAYKALDTADKAWVAAYKALDTADKAWVAAYKAWVGTVEALESYDQEHPEEETE